MADITFPIIILAAGASARMRGRDKLLEDVDGKPLLSHQAQMARQATSGPIIVTLPPGPHPRYMALQGMEVLCLEIPDAAEGMSASLRRAIAALPPDTPCAMILLADLPALTTADLMEVAKTVDLGSDTLIWRGATDDGAAGHPIIFKADLFEQFAMLSGDDGGRSIVSAAGDHVVLVPLPGKRARLDLDTPEDWAEWRTLRSAKR